MSFKSFIATPLFLVLANAAWAAEPTPAPGSQRYADVPPSNFSGQAAPGGLAAAEDTSAIGMLLPAVQKVREAANRSPQAGAHHSGGVNVALGDGSVRNGVSPVGGNETISIGAGSTETAKGVSLGSLNSIGSIGQLATPPGAPPAQAQNNLKQLGLASHNYDSSAGTGDVNGDGVKDVIVSTGTGGGPQVKSGPGGGPHIKAIDGARNTGPAGGAAQVRVFSGNAAAGAGNAAALKGQALRKN